MLKTRSQADVAKDKASDAASSASDALSAVKDMVVAAGGAVADVAGDKAHAAKEAAAPQVEKLAEKAADRTKDQRKAARKAAKKSKKKAAKRASSTQGLLSDKASDAQSVIADKAAAARDAIADSAVADKVSHATGVTPDQVNSMIHDQWMPRIQDAITAASAAAAAHSAHAYRALPDNVQDRVEYVVPQAKKLKKRKGKGLIFLGLLAGAGAAALIYKGQQEKKKRDALRNVPVVEQVDRVAVEEGDRPVGTVPAPVDDLRPATAPVKDGENNVGTDRPGTN